MVKANFTFNYFIYSKDSSQASETRSTKSSFSTANAARRLSFWLSKSLLHFVSWGEFLVRVEIDEVCPAKDCESFSVIAVVAGNCTSELVDFPAWFSFYKWYWTIGFVSQANVAAFDATIFDIAPYSSLPLLFAFQEVSDLWYSMYQHARYTISLDGICPI